MHIDHQNGYFLRVRAINATGSMDYYSSTSDFTKSIDNYSTYFRVYLAYEDVEDLAAVLWQAKAEQYVTETNKPWAGATDYVASLDMGFDETWTIENVEEKIDAAFAAALLTDTDANRCAYLNGKYISLKFNRAGGYIATDGDSSNGAIGSGDLGGDDVWRVDLVEGTDNEVRLYNIYADKYLCATFADGDDRNLVPALSESATEGTVFSFAFEGTNVAGTVALKSKLRAGEGKEFLYVHGGGSKNLMWYYPGDPGSSLYLSVMTEEDVIDKFETSADAIYTQMFIIGVDGQLGQLRPSEAVLVITANQAYQAEKNAANVCKYYKTAADNIEKRQWACFRIIYDGDVYGLTPGANALSSGFNSSNNWYGNAAEDKLDLRQAWIVYGYTSEELVNGTYDIFNIETGKHIFYGISGSTNFDNLQYKIQDHSADDAEHKNLFYYFGGNNCWIKPTDAVGNISASRTYTQADSKWRFEYVGKSLDLQDAVAKSEAYRAVKTQFDAIPDAIEAAGVTELPVGKRLGEYALSEQWNKAVEDYQAMTETILNFDATRFNEINTTVTAGNAYALNMPKNGTYFRAVASPNNTYGGQIHYTTERYSNKQSANVNTATDENSLLLYYNDAIISVCNGMQMGVTVIGNKNFPTFNSSADNNEAFAATFLPAHTGEVSAYNIRFGADRYVHMWNKNNPAFSYLDVCSSANNDVAHNFSLEQVDELSVKVEGDYGTFYCAVPMTVPADTEGYEYYGGKVVPNENEAGHFNIVFEPIAAGVTVAEGTAVVVLGDDGIAKLNVAYEPETEPVADYAEAFHGTHVATLHNEEEGNWTFGHGVAAAAEANAAMTLAASDAPAITLGRVAHGAAKPVNALMLTVPARSPMADGKGSVLTMSLDGENNITTGIDRVIFEKADGSCLIFDLQGRRLGAPVKGQVNIIDGRKVYVK